MLVNVKQEVENSIIELIREFTMYGHVLCQLPKIFNDTTQTMAVGKHYDELLIKLYIGIPYLTECFQKNPFRAACQHIMEVLKHETLHIVVCHLSFNMPDKARFATACDLEVNSYCNRTKFLLNKDGSPGGVFPKDYNLPDKQGAMWYYNELLKNPEFNRQKNGGAFNPGGKNGTIVTSHELWDAAKQDPMLKEVLKDMVRKAIEICKQTGKYGSVPAELVTMVEKTLVREKPIIPWQKVLRMFVASSSETNLAYTMRKRSKRYGTRPGTTKEDVLNLAVGIDSSGSISDQQIKTFFNELFWMSKNGVKIHVFECDTEIHKDYPFERFDGHVTGRGGTDLKPVLDRVSDERYDALIYFTDFEAPDINEVYNLPILWVLSQCHMQPEQYPYKRGTFLDLKDYDLSEAV